MRKRTDKGTASIDVVITWVDGSDAAWCAQKQRYAQNAGVAQNTHIAQYRDFDTLRYVFRSIEQYAPWVSRIFLVTCGQIPSWLDVHHPKLRLVDHRDYIPASYLPTFNSHAIELNFHRIADLSETFVYFNDDMLLCAKTSPTDFFVDGLPCDSAILRPIIATVPSHPFVHYLLNNLAVINRHYPIQAAVRAAPAKWFSPKYGAQLLKNILYTVHQDAFCGFRNFHMPSPHLKSTFAKLWDMEPQILDRTCANRFRSLTDVTPYLASYVNFCENRFVPASPCRGRYFDMTSDFDALLSVCQRQKHPFLVINDNDTLADGASAAEALHRVLETLYPKKSGYER